MHGRCVFLCEGLQFLRFICLLNTPELLQLLHVIKTNNHIRVVKVVTIMSIVWMLGASMYFLVSITTFKLLYVTIVVIKKLMMYQSHKGEKSCATVDSSNSTFTVTFSFGAKVAQR